MTQPATHEELRSRREAAAFLKISLRTLETLGIPRVQVSTRRVAYRLSDLLRYVQSKLSTGR